MANIKFHQMVSYYRKQKGWTMKELAEKMGKTESAVSKWESGTASPKIKDINELSKILGVHANSLIFGSTTAKENDAINETIEIMKKLDDAAQANILNFARFEFSQAEQAAKNKENQNTAS